MWSDDAVREALAGERNRAASASPSSLKHVTADEPEAALVVRRGALRVRECTSMASSMSNCWPAALPGLAQRRAREPPTVRPVGASTEPCDTASAPTPRRRTRPLGVENQYRHSTRRRRRASTSPESTPCPDHGPEARSRRRHRRRQRRVHPQTMQTTPVQPDMSNHPATDVPPDLTHRLPSPRKCLSSWDRNALLHTHHPTSERRFRGRAPRRAQNNQG